RDATGTEVQTCALPILAQAAADAGRPAAARAIARAAPARALGGARAAPVVRAAGWRRVDRERRARVSLDGVAAEDRRRDRSRERSEESRGGRGGSREG